MIAAAQEYKWESSGCTAGFLLGGLATNNLTILQQKSLGDQEECCNTAKFSIALFLTIM